MVPDIQNLTMEQLEAGLDEIRRSPKDAGVLELIVRRPQTDEREMLDEGFLDTGKGLVGDKWNAQGGVPPTEGDRDTQITFMNSRTAALLAQAKERWQLAGDQLFIDLDLSDANLPPGTRLSIGSAVIEVTAIPHNGCRKFAARFGPDSVRFVNSAAGKQLHLRGINARVVESGKVRVGDAARKIT